MPLYPISQSSGSSSGGTTSATWVSVNSNYTAKSGDKLLVSSSSPWTLTLPAVPNFGDEVDLQCLSGLSTNKVSFNLNGKKYKASSPGFVGLNQEYCGTVLIYANDSVGWVPSVPANVYSYNAYPVEVLSDSPWTYLRLGESSGTVATDSSSNVNNGTYNNVTLGGTSSLSYDSNKSVTFNGSTSYISFSSTVTNPVNFTLECRFKTTAATGGLIGFGNSQGTGSSTFDRDLNLSSGKVQGYFYPGPSITSTSNYNDGLWHTATLVCNSGQAALYVDGILIISATESLQSYTGYWHIGHTKSAGFFSGSIDEVSITLSGLSSSRVATRQSAASS